MTYFLHEKGLCESANVGDGTRIWAFAHVLPGAHIGRDCNICDGVFIENDVRLGDRVTVKCGVQLWDGISVEDDVFIGPNATFTNDPMPRSKQPPAQFARTIVQRGASIGANATLLPGITIGQESMVGAGAVVTRSVPRFAIVVGNPARIIGYINAKDRHAVPNETGRAGENRPAEAGVGGSRLVRLPRFEDMRGSLAVAEFDRHLPFVPKRYFAVFGVPSEEVRGEHAHRTCHQFLCCVRGAVSVVVDDGRSREEHLLDAPELGLHIPPMVWATQYRYAADAVLLVFASSNYDAAEYIRDYEEFLQNVATLHAR